MHINKDSILQRRIYMRKKQNFYIIVLLTLTFILTFINPDISPLAADTTAYPTASAAEKVALSKSTIYLNIDETADLKITGTTKKVTWTSSSKSIALVSNTGKVKACSYGKATITASVNNKKYKCKVIVVDRLDIELEQSMTDRYIYVGGSGVKLNPTSYRYSAAEIKGMQLTYKVSGSGAKVSKKGLVTATKKGKFKVTAYFRNKVVDSISMEALPAFSGFEKAEVSLPTVSNSYDDSNYIRFANGFKIYYYDYFDEDTELDDLVIVSSDPEVATAYGSYEFDFDGEDYYSGINIETGRDGVATISLTVDGITKSIKVIVGLGVTIHDPVYAVQHNDFTGYDEDEKETLTWVRDFFERNNLYSDDLTDREKITIVQNYLNATYHTNLSDTTSAYYKRILFGGSWNAAGDCGLYQDIFCFLMECLNIEVWMCDGIATTPDGGSGSHGWNKVKADGTWYYIDAYWTAALKNTTYFLSEELWPDHILYENVKDPENYDEDEELVTGILPIYTWSDDEVHYGCEGTYQDMHYGETFTKAGFGLAWY